MVSPSPSTVALTPNSPSRDTADSDGCLMSTMLPLVLTHSSFIVLLALTFGLIFGFEEYGGVGFNTKTNAAGVFSWHPLLNLIAYGVLMAEGLISFRVWGWARPNRKTLHAVLQCVVSILAVLSLTAVVIFHRAINAPNFYSVHSWIGLLVYVFTWCQFLGGLFVFGLPNMASPELKARLMPLHKFSGLLLYVTALMAMVSGLLQKQSFIRSSLSTYAPVIIFSNFMALWLVVTAAAVLWHIGREQIKARQT
eukprot:GHVS01075984.1.p1 GENE.GHVS01075984.1~~GHVS01075984.1.p1  ORF type:complete len:252 (-),score=20.55 GHVS01075984.1:119-874(-)